MKLSTPTDWRPHMRGNGVLQRKLAQLSDQVLKLETHMREVSLETFCEDWTQQAIAERALQISVEIMIDVSERILAIENAGPAATAGEALASLVHLEVLKDVQPYREMVKFRNLLVHQYAEIDSRIVYDIATNRLNDFRAFRQEIDLWADQEA